MLLALSHTYIYILFSPNLVSSHVIIDNTLASVFCYSFKLYHELFSDGEILLAAHKTCCHITLSIMCMCYVLCVRAYSCFLYICINETCTLINVHDAFMITISL